MNENTAATLVAGGVTLPAGISALIDRPVDALVGFRGVNHLMEIKTARGKLRASQRAFLDGWRGSVSVVRSVEDALTVIGVL
jgi:hypothetical protein